MVSCRGVKVLSPCHSHFYSLLRLRASHEWLRHCLYKIVISLISRVSTDDDNVDGSGNGG